MTSRKKSKKECEFMLINPVIIGTYESSVFSHTPIEAADMFWQSLTKHIAGHVPQFAFTISDDSNNIYSFLVKENKTNSNYRISEIEIDIDVNDIFAYHGNVIELMESEVGTSGPLEKKKLKVDITEPFDKIDMDDFDDSSSDSSNSSDSYGSDNSPDISSSDSDSNVDNDVDLIDGYLSDVDLHLIGSHKPETTPIAVFNYTTKYYHQDDGPTIEYKSTLNPKIEIVDVPKKKNRVVVNYKKSGRFRRNFSSIPVFREPLVPIVNIWEF